MTDEQLLLYDTRGIPGTREIHFLARDQPALMVVYKNSDRWGASDVSVTGDLVTAYASPPLPGMTYVNMGLSVVRREALAGLQRGRPASLQELFAPLIARRQLLAWETAQRFYEIGSPAGLEEFRRLVAVGVDR
jgi:NDP-sugar pyrophosphorylase family protein